MKLSVTVPAPRCLWHRVYRDDPRALVTQSPEYLDCLCRLSGYRDVSRLYATAGGGHVVVPMAWHRAGIGPLAQPESLPEGWGAGGPLGRSADKPGVLAAIMGDLAALPAVRVCVRPDPVAAGAWLRSGFRGAVTRPRCDYVLDLRAGFQALEAGGFDRQVRSGLRKAAQAGVEIECDCSGRLVDDFHKLFKLSIARWARCQNEPRWFSRLRVLRREPPARLAAIARDLGDMCRIWLARVGGVPAAAIVVLQDANAQYIRGAMDQDLAGPSGANFLLHWHAIRNAARIGCRYYHMGETRPGSSLARFKAHFGAIPYHYTEYRFERVPISAAEDGLRRLVKAAIGFRDI